MIELVTSQAESDRAFRRWAEVLVESGVPSGYGWIIEGSGVFFSRYGQGVPGKIVDQVMLGTDQKFESGVVKVVLPNVSQRDKGRLTVIGRVGDGRLLLLREGRLQKNSLSRAIRADFQALSGLEPVDLKVGGVSSARSWYVVADLSDTPDDILAQTASFAVACTLARSRAGGGKADPEPEPDQSPALGRDEQGRIITVERQGGSAEICALQGFVWQALKAALGESFTKPKRNGFEVDGVVETANLLIEIKTGVSAKDVYEAVGQLMLYPSIIGLKAGLRPALLVPDKPSLRPRLAAALATVPIEVYTYAVGGSDKAPKIAFSKAFLDRCRRASSA